MSDELATVARLDLVGPLICRVVCWRVFWLVSTWCNGLRRADVWLHGVFRDWLVW
jgi:hypothetical protein